MDGKKLFSLLSALVFSGYLLFSGGLANLARAAQVTVTATAKVLQTIVLTKTADLDFGEGIQSDPAKVIAPAGTGAAAFSVQGEPNHSYVIVLPAAALNLTRTGGTETIAISAFAHNAGATPTLGTTGAATFRVGGTRAALSATQVAGTYTGSFPVIVTY